MSALVASCRQYVANKGVAGLLRDAGLVAVAIAPLWLCRNGSASTPLKIAACVCAAVLCALVDRALWRRLTLQPLLRRSLAFALGLGVAWLLLRNSLEARLWIIDDHEIPDSIAVGKVSTLSGLWHMLGSHREIGSPPWSYPRYRPSYYTLRYIETYLWGLDAGYWYLVRLLLVGVSFALAWQALLLVAGPAQASLTLLFALGAPFWGDVLCRLGPSEQYAMLGCALFVYGASISLRELEGGRDAPLRHWCLAALGSVIAVGSKENFVFIPGLLVLLTAVAAYRGRLSRSRAWISALALSYAAWVVLVVIVSVRRHGATVYGKDASLGSAPTLAFEGVAALYFSLAGWILPGLLGAAACVVYRRSPGFQRRFAALAVGLALLAGVYALQVVVYKGQIADNMRYAFPAGLIGTLVVSLAFAALRWEAAASALPQRWLRALDAVLLATATYLVATTGFRPLKQLVLQNAGRSQTFDNAIEAAAAKLRAEPTRPLLFSASAPDNDLEPLVSIRIYLQYYGVENPMFLSLPPEAGGRMAERMHSWSAQGLVDWQEDEGLHGVPGPHGKFLPMGELSAWGKPFGIAISAPLPPGVEPIGMAW